MSEDVARLDTGRRRTRRYDSSLRQRMAQQNRQVILEAATALFAELGWGASVREIAGSAGVSVETVYSHFGSKVDLLMQVLDVAVVGDDDPVALMDRPEFAELADGDLTERVAAAAALNTAINRRTTKLFKALREGAGAEPALSQRLEEMREQQRQTIHLAAATVAGRDVTSTEADGLWSVLSQEVYELLSGSAGWSPAQYQDWLAEALTRLLRRND